MIALFFLIIIAYSLSFFDPRSIYCLNTNQASDPTKFIQIPIFFYLTLPKPKLPKTIQEPFKKLSRIQIFSAEFLEVLHRLTIKAKW